MTFTKCQKDKKERVLENEKILKLFVAFLLVVAVI